MCEYFHSAEAAEWNAKFQHAYERYIGRLKEMGLEAVHFLPESDPRCESVRQLYQQYQQELADLRPVAKADDPIFGLINDCQDTRNSLFTLACMPRTDVDWQAIVDSLWIDADAIVGRVGGVRPIRPIVTDAGQTFDAVNTLVSWAESLPKTLKFFVTLDDIGTLTRKAKSTIQNKLSVIRRTGEPVPNPRVPSRGRSSAKYCYRELRQFMVPNWGDVADDLPLEFAEAQDMIQRVQEGR